MNKIKDSDIWSETHWTKGYMAEVMERAFQLSADPSKVYRLQIQECRFCYYSSKVGGAAMTEATCKNCEKIMSFGSTCTDKLCKECAQKLKVCRHCMADIDLKIKKNGWVAP